MSDKITIVVNGEETKLENSGKLNALVHKNDINISEILGYTEIGSPETIIRARSLSDSEWIFFKGHMKIKRLFDMVFDDTLKMPDCAIDIQKSDKGVQHIIGLLVLSLEQFLKGNSKLFFRTPEDHLHPAVVARLVGALNAMMSGSWIKEELGLEKKKAA